MCHRACARAHSEWAKGLRTNPATPTSSCSVLSATRKRKKPVKSGEAGKIGRAVCPDVWPAQAFYSEFPERSLRLVLFFCLMVRRYVVRRAIVKPRLSFSCTSLKTCALPLSFARGCSDKGAKHKAAAKDPSAPPPRPPCCRPERDDHQRPRQRLQRMCRGLGKTLRVGRRCFARVQAVQTRRVRVTLSHHK